MPSYAYVNGDGLAVISSATPNGAVEPVSNLDDAIRQVKAYLNDPTAGPKALIDALDVRIDGLDTDAIAIDTAILDIIDDIVAIQDDEKQKAIITHLGGQSITAGAGITPVQYNNEDLDSAAAFSVVTYSFTAPIAGAYMVLAQLQLSTTASAAPTDIIHQLDIFVDAASGARIRVEMGTDVADQTLHLARMFDLSLGQVIKVQYTLTVASGTMTVQVATDPRETVLQIVRVAA